MVVNPLLDDDERLHGLTKIACILSGLPNDKWLLHDSALVCARTSSSVSQTHRCGGRLPILVVTPSDS